jgi:hypothetical protein
MWLRAGRAATPSRNPKEGFSSCKYRDLQCIVSSCISRVSDAQISSDYDTQRLDLAHCCYRIGRGISVECGPEWRSSTMSWHTLGQSWSPESIDVTTVLAFVTAPGASAPHSITKSWLLKVEKDSVELLSIVPHIYIELEPMSLSLAAQKAVCQNMWLPISLPSAQRIKGKAGRRECGASVRVHCVWTVYMLRTGEFPS